MNDYTKMPFLPKLFRELLADEPEHLKAVAEFERYFENLITVEDLLKIYPNYFDLDELKECLDKMAGIDQMT